MSAGVAKAAEMFANRTKEVAIVRSLRENPLDYAYTNDQIENFGSGDTAVGVEENVSNNSKKS